MTAFLLVITGSSLGKRPLTRTAVITVRNKEETLNHVHCRENENEITSQVWWHIPALGKRQEEQEFEASFERHRKFNDNLS